ncbi:hypothetical protein JYU34_014804 [Plutella xylostella]|uniref:Uncharacterized protein n=1 Tax=Plutella xylostella TaxID=51655 RepID=A0ABQ7Q963_PLUXY|nr:hypothetical protein JYU34_014804 [Plutella xylostella]
MHYVYSRYDVNHAQYINEGKLLTTDKSSRLNKHNHIITNPSFAVLKRCIVHFLFSTKKNRQPNFTNHRLCNVSKLKLKRVFEKKNKSDNIKARGNVLFIKVGACGAALFQPA